jgi:replicative DNA helicase
MSDALTLPHSLEAELAVLGAVIVDNAAYVRAAERMSADDFYSPVFRRVWEVCSREILAGRSISAVKLQMLFEGDEDFREAGGARLLAHMISGPAIGPEVQDFAKQLRELGVRRRIIQAAWKLAKTARDTSGLSGFDGETLLSAAQEEIAGVATEVAPNSWKSSRDSTVAALRKVADARGSTGLSTGLVPLDRKIGGLFAGDLIVLGGRPSMGKSALCDQIEENVALQPSPDPSTGVPGPLNDEAVRRRVVAKFSLEMDDEQLGYRNAARLAHKLFGARIAYEKIRKGEISPEEWRLLRNAMERAPEIRWDVTPGINLHHMRVELRRLLKTYGRIDLVTCDYLQIMDTARGKGENLAEAISRLTKGLKSIAREFGVPVVALSQLSRDVEKRDDKRPMMADLRDSGSIEADADVVLLAYRKFYYLDRAPEPKDPVKAEQHRVELADCEPELTVIVGKQRMGAIGDVRLFWSAETSLVASTREEVAGGLSAPEEPAFEYGGGLL